MRDRRGASAALWPALALSVLYTLALFDWGFLSGRGPYWQHLQLWDLDRAQALIGWRYYAYDVWRFPIFSVATLGYPEGTNIIFTDSIPLAALGAKVLHGLTGKVVNYLGLWMGLCYVGQGVAAALLLHALGVRDRLVVLCGVLIALSASILLARFGHAALSAHFLVLAALTAYFRLVERGGRWFEWTLLMIAPAAGLLVTSYLGVMLAGLAVATVLEAARRRRASAGVAAASCLALPVVMLATMRIAGMIGPDAPSPEGSGYGHFSMNLLAPVFGTETSWTQRLLGPVVVDATGGQYEGFNYLGAGVLALALLCVATGARDVVRAVARHPILTAVLAAFASYALGNAVFVGATEIARFTPPSRALWLASAFRSSGRFFWPAYYTITFGLVAWTAERFPPRAALALLLVVALAQYVESAPLRATVRNAAAQVNAPYFVDARVAVLAARAQRLFVYPSYECTRDDEAWPHPESWRASVVELELAISERALPTNSAYVSRGRKDCDAETRALATAPLEPGTLSVVRRTVVPDFAARFGAAAECLETDGAILCLAP
jgi:hypothetical protein